MFALALGPSMLLSISQIFMHGPLIRFAIMTSVFLSRMKLVQKGLRLFGQDQSQKQAYIAFDDDVFSRLGLVANIDKELRTF